AGAHRGWAGGRRRGGAAPALGCVRVIDARIEFGSVLQLRGCAGCSGRTYEAQRSQQGIALLTAFKAELEDQLIHRKRDAGVPIFTGPRESAASVVVAHADSLA